MVAGIRGGKCLSVDQGVLLSNGTTVKAGLILVGDKILGFNKETGKSVPCSVISTELTKKTTAKYTLSDNSSFICSLDHAFPCWNTKRNRFEEWPIDHIVKRSDNYLYLLGSKQTIFSDQTELSIHPYLLGVILGDGCITQKSCLISSADKEILEACASLSGLEVKHRSKYDYAIVSHEKTKEGYGYNHIVSKLRDLNLMGRNSYTKFIPKEYLTADINSRKEILAGLIDTDGSIDGKRGRIEYTTCSYELATGVQFILRSFGIRARVNSRVTQDQNGIKCNSFRISFTDNLDLPLRIKRKKDRLAQRIAQCSDMVYVKSVEYLGEKDCIDISIDHPDHLFLLDNFIATHNTYSGARQAIKEAWNAKGKGVFLIIAPTYNMLDRTTWVEFKEAAKPFIAKENDSKKIITLKNGRKVHGHSAENPDRIRNETAVGAWADECREFKDFKKVWNVLLGRVLSTNGKIFCTTSPNSYDDIHEIFIANKKPGYGLVKFPTYANTFLNKESIDTLASDYDAKFMQQELLGEFVIFEGAVYYTFRRDKNAGDLAFKVCQYNPNIPIGLCADFNVDPLAWVLTQTVRNSKGLAEVYVIDEIFLRNSNTIEACKEFRNRYPSHNTGLVLYGDATGQARHSSSNVTNWMIIQEELGRYGIDKRVPTKNPAERDRINAVNAMICNSKNERRVLVNPRCKNLIRDLEQVNFKEGTSQIDKTKDAMLTHISDALGYQIEKEFSLNKARIEAIRI